MKNSMKNRKNAKVTTAMITDLGERSLNKQHNNRTIVIPKIALDNCGCDTTSNKLSEIGKITEKTMEVNLNADKKRFWLESLTGINHKMNRSLPLSLNYFTKDEI